MSSEDLLNSIYGYLYREYNNLHENVSTNGFSIWVDVDGKTFCVSVNECPNEKENNNAA